MYRIVIIAILAVFYLFGDSTHLSEGGLSSALLYPLYHANLFHLLANGFAIYTIFSPQKKDNARALIIGYIVSVIVYPLSIRPLIGVSNILYAIIGLRTPPLSSQWWHTAPVRVFLCVTVAMVFIPQVAAITHVISFTIGIVVAHLLRHKKK